MYDAADPAQALTMVGEELFIDGISESILPVGFH